MQVTENKTCSYSMYSCMMQYIRLPLKSAERGVWCAVLCVVMLTGAGHMGNGHHAVLLLTRKCTYASYIPVFFLLLLWSKHSYTWLLKDINRNCWTILLLTAVFQCPFVAEFVLGLHKKILTDPVTFPERWAARAWWRIYSKIRHLSQDTHISCTLILF